jgi:hypothetical protein
LTHNGWTNYETWLFWAHMTNDQHWYNEMHRITADYNDEDSTSSDLAEALSNFMDDEIYGQLEIRVPILIDLIETTIAKVNWEEIADALIEERKEAWANAGDNS